MSFEKPEDIRHSIKTNNRKHLSRAGRKGAETTNQIKHFKKVSQEEIDRQNKIDLIYQDVLHKEGEEAAKEWLKEFGSE